MTIPRLTVCMIVLGLLAPAGASAKVLSFEGTGQGDPATTVSFDVKGKVKRVTLKSGKRRKRFVASRVSNIRVVNQRFTCYRADGSAAYSGRTSYAGFASIPPTKVNKRGRFKGLYVYPELDLNPTMVYEFKGKIVDRKASGAFRGQYGIGGIDYGYCGDNAPQPWKAKG